MPSPEVLHSVLRMVSEPKSNYCAVLSVPGIEGYKLGRSVDGEVVLLTPADSKPDPPTELQNLSLNPRVRLLVREEGAQTGEEVTMGFVGLRSEGSEMVDAFLSVAATLLRIWGEHPAPGEISAGLRTLVRLFDPVDAERRSLVGVFGELVTIFGSVDPAQMIDTWHVNAEDKFDFATIGERIEVKTTLNPRRIHTFDLDQLHAPSGAVLSVVSIMTTESDNGLTVAGLVKMIDDRLAAAPDAQLKVRRQLASSLGTDWFNSRSVGFDFAQALASMRILNASHIPRVAQPPKEVLSVSLKVDCSDVPVHIPSGGLAALLQAG